VAALSPWALGHDRLSRWQVSDVQVRWISAQYDMLPRYSEMAPRYPVEDEKPYITSQLPLGDPAPVQIYHRFKLDRLANGPLAVWLPAVDGNVRLYANGVQLDEESEPSARSTARPSARSRWWTIPQTVLHRGENRIDIVVDDTQLRALTSSIHLGPESLLKPAALWSETLIETARKIILVLAVLALTVNLIAVIARAPYLHLAIAAFFAVSGTRVVLADAMTTLGRFWAITDQMLVAGMLLAIMCIAPDSLGSANKIRRRVDGTLLLTLGLLGLGSLLTAWFGSSAAVLVGVATIAASTVYTGWVYYPVLHLADEGSRPRRVMLGIAIGATLMVVLVAVTGATGINLPEPPFAAEITITLSLATLAVLAIGLGSVEAINRVFAFVRVRLDQGRIIQQQKVALDATTLALDRRTRESAVLEERQRMARDVHDGIGGQLASLIAQVRLRRVSMEDVEEALTGGLSELRLLVDSLDLVGETLADALVAFLNRARQQTEAAGITFEWEQNADFAAAIRDPKWILNLYRLMQEAITNAIRHSGGSRISVFIERVDDSYMSVRVVDNGTCFDPSAEFSGRGLANMAYRAKELGGALSITHAANGKGMVVRIYVPIP